jgi:aerobic carbon-monoxide dehydrogenase small subunit
VPTISLRVNGREETLDVASRTLLVTALRETLKLTGTHVGCDTSSCGACTVLLDGAAAKSCTVLAVQAAGHDVTTIEGIATKGALHPVQDAFRTEHGLQCGFCTPGMIVSCVALLRQNVAPSDEDVRYGIAGNVCRCTGYENIVRAVQVAARTLRAQTEAAR